MKKSKCEIQVKTEQSNDKIKVIKISRASGVQTENEVSKYNYTDLNTMINDIRQATVGRFNESIDICYTLGINTKKQSVNTSVILPYGIPRKSTLCVFADGEEAEIARNSGADIVGGEELINIIINSGNVNFQYCIATHSIYKKVVAIAKILSKKKIMPSEKNGTVIKTSKELHTLITEFKEGKRIKIKNDSSGYVRCSIGRANFSNEMLIDNIRAITFALEAVKPPKAKLFITSLDMSTTMLRCSVSCSVKVLSQSIRNK